MSYTPNNASIYLAAFSGCLSGLNQAGLEAARIADAYAQELDTLWGVAGFTTLETTEIESLSESVWLFRSPLPASAAFTPSAYQAIATKVIALAQQGNAVVVAQGIDPNAGGGGGSGPAASNLGVLWTALATMVASAATAVVQLNGYSAVGDGGGGVVFWNPTDTRAGNGGTIQAVTGVVTGRWNRLFDANNINVRWWGAKGNGSTDDTTAVQNAYNYFSGRSSSVSGVVFFPQGVYPISSTLTYTGNPNSSVEFLGDKAGGNGTQLFWIGASNGIMVHSFGLFLSSLTNLYFNGNPAGSISGTTATCGWWFDTDQSGGGSGSENVTIDHCTFTGFKGSNAGVNSSGVWLGETGGSFDIFGYKFYNCFFTGDSSSPAQYTFACVQNLAGGAGNTEDFYFDHCQFQFAQYAMYAPHSNNNMGFEDCTFLGISTEVIHAGAGQIRVVGAAVEIVNASKQCLFINTNSTDSTVTIEASEIVIDGTNNTPSGVLFSCSGHLILKNTFVDGTGGGNTPSTIAAIQTGDAAMGGKSSVKVEGCIWYAQGASGTFGPPQQIPVYNSMTLITGTPADQGTSQITGELHYYQVKLQHNSVYNGNLSTITSLQDADLNADQSWITGLVDNGISAPYYMPQNVFRGLPFAKVTGYVIDTTNPTFKQNTATVSIWLGSQLRGTAILMVIADTQTVWAGAGVTGVNLEVGSDIAATEDLLSHNVHTAPIVAGLLSGDLGAALATPVQGANLNGWGGGRGILATFTFAGANPGNGVATTLTTGKTIIYVVTGYMGYP